MFHAPNPGFRVGPEYIVVLSVRKVTSEVPRSVSLPQPAVGTQPINSDRRCIVDVDELMKLKIPPPGIAKSI